MGTEASAITEKVAVDLAVVAVVHAFEIAVALARKDVAAHRTARADRRRRLQVPLARVLPGERPVREHARRADLDQVAGEFVLELAVRRAAEVHPAAGTQRFQVRTTGVVAVEAHAPITGDAPIHLVADERAKVLIAPGSFRTPIAALGMARHDGHVLQVALAALLADRTVVRMVFHQPLDHRLAETGGMRRGNGQAHAVAHGRDAGHDHAPALVVLVGIFHDGALPAGADRAHGRVPTEIGQIKVLRQHRLQHVLSGLGLVALAVNDNGRHLLSGPPNRRLRSCGTGSVPREHAPRSLRGST